LQGAGGRRNGNMCRNLEDPKRTSTWGIKIITYSTVANEKRKWQRKVRSQISDPTSKNLER
jgi:hypothetical protein